MKISNAARLIFWLAAIFAIGILVRAESSEKRANIANTKSAPLRIVDQNGRPAVSGVPSATSQIVDVAVGPGGRSRFTRTQSTFRWATRCDGPGPAAATASPAALLARPIRNFVRLTTRTALPGILYQSRLRFIRIHFRSAGTYSYHCSRALCSWHDRRGQCDG